MRFIIGSLLFLLLACSEKAAQRQSFKISFIEQDSPLQLSLRGISVVDSNVVWLSGAKGSILKTLDGGKNWSVINQADQDSLDYRGIYASSTEQAIVVSAGFPARVYKTINGGLSWELVYENLDSAVFMNSIAFRGPQQGVIFGDQLGDCHLILQTLDAGNTWRRISCEKLPKPLTFENGFAASNSCIAVTRQRRYVIGLGGLKSRVFTSPRGLAWQANHTTLGGGLSSRGIYALAAGRQRLIAVGGDYTKPDSTYQASISNDQGKTWQSGGVLNGYRSVVDYSSKHQLWMAAGTNGVDYSEDHGKSWKKVSQLELNTLQFDQASGLAWATSSKGRIFRIEIKSN